MPKSKKEGLKGIFYIRAESIEDISRCACRFDYSSDLLLLYKTPKGNRLISLGERIGDIVLAYYAIVKESGRIILYTPASDGGKEKASFVDKEEQPGKYYISVMRADLSNLATAKSLGKKAVEIIRTESAVDLISSSIKRTAKDEMLAQIYSFPFKGKRVLGAFDIVDAFSNDKTIFYFSFYEGKETASFARYDYREDKLDFTNIMSEHAYMYAKVINLAEQFPFFKQTK